MSNITNEVPVVENDPLSEFTNDRIVFDVQVDKYTKVKVPGAYDHYMLRMFDILAAEQNKTLYLQP